MMGELTMDPIVSVDDGAFELLFLLLMTVCGYEIQSANVADITTSTSSLRGLALHSITLCTVSLFFWAVAVGRMLLANKSDVGVWTFVLVFITSFRTADTCMPTPICFKPGNRFPCLLSCICCRCGQQNAGVPALFARQLWLQPASAWVVAVSYTHQLLTAPSHELPPRRQLFLYIGLIYWMTAGFGLFWKLWFASSAKRDRDDGVLLPLCGDTARVRAQSGSTHVRSGANSACKPSQANEMVDFLKAKLAKGGKSASASPALAFDTNDPALELMRSWGTPSGACKAV